jgi:5'-nucleotidase
MKILISNDDGYNSPGIKALHQSLSEIAEVTVVAPEKNKSASSSSLTLDRPLTVTEVEKDFFYIDGTPTDCVHIALSGFLNFIPDMVVSGINNGANMGDDTIYSGTLAAAMEGFLLGIPSLAISMAEYNSKHLSTGAKISLDIVKKLKNKKNPFLFNINVPNINYINIKGFEITRLGKRHKAEPVIHYPNQNEKKMYWVGAAGQPNDGGEGTDFFAVKNNFVSISPIMSDLTDHSNLEKYRKWLEFIK